MVRFSLIEFDWVFLVLVVVTEYFWVLLGSIGFLTSATGFF